MVPGVSLADHEKNSISDELAQIPTPSFKDLSEIDPLDSLGNVTAPLDSIWGILGDKLNLDSWQVYPKLLKSAPEGLSGSKDTLDGISVWGIIGIAKSSFILVANILVAVLEVVLTILRSILGLIG